jgi:hypothetical protein
VAGTPDAEGEHEGKRNALLCVRFVASSFNRTHKIEQEQNDSDNNARTHHRTLVSLRLVFDVQPTSRSETTDKHKEKRERHDQGKKNQEEETQTTKQTPHSKGKLC